jgi:predicted small lipoprotein YifL
MNVRELLLLMMTLGLLAGCGSLGPGSSGRDDDDDDDDSAADDDDDDDDDATGDDDDDATPPGPVDVTISELTAGDIPDGTPVTVTGAVVTTPVTNDEDRNSGSVWIQDGDQPGDGIMLFMFFDTSVAVSEAVSVGDVVTVTGTYSKPFEFHEITLFNVEDIEVTGTDDLPAPVVVDAEDIEAGFVSDDLLIGMLVQIQDVTVDVSPGFATFFEWEADGVIIDAPLFDDTVDGDDDGDAWMYADVMPGYVLDSVTGVLHVDFGDAQLFTRFESDLVFSYPGCDAAFTGVAALNCTAADGDAASVTGLVVNSPSPFFGGFYAQMSTGGDFEGIQVFWFEDDLVTPPAIGTTIDVDGFVNVFRGQKQITVIDAADLTVGAAGTVDPVVVANACDIDERHAGLLVQIPSVTVEEQDGDANNFGYYEVDGCNHIRVESDFIGPAEDFAANTGGGGEIVDLVGIVKDENDTYGIHPRTTSDWTSWGD